MAAPTCDLARAWAGNRGESSRHAPGNAWQGPPNEVLLRAAQSVIMPPALLTALSFPFRRRGSFWLFGAIAFLYLFSTSRERPWGDATPIWEVADSIAHAHNLYAKTRWPMGLQNGKDGKLYGLAPLFQSAIHVPGAALQRALVARYPPIGRSFGASPRTWRPPCSAPCPVCFSSGCAGGWACGPSPRRPPRWPWPCPPRFGSIRATRIPRRCS
jgi:hypothetical protein